MNSKMVTSHGTALLFMQQCRQTSALSFPAKQARYASQAAPLPSTTRSTPPRRTRTPPATAPKPRGVYSEGRSPTERRVEISGPSIWTAIKTVLGIKPKPAADYVPAQFNVYNNPYRARKKWPPNFKILHPKHQFRYEKTYRRRMKLKYARPRWTKATKLVQWGLIYGTMFYWVFLMEMGPDGKHGTPFDNVSCHSISGQAFGKVR